MTLADDLRRLGFSTDQIAAATVNGKPLAEACPPKEKSEPFATWHGNTLRVVVPGSPSGKPRMTRQDKWKQRPRVVRYRDWCDRVRKSAGPLPAVEHILSVNWTAYFEPPSSWPKKKRVAAIGTLHRTKPDRDNIDKAVLDCLFKDDQGVAAGTIRKVWDWKPRLEIEILTDLPGVSA